MDGLTITAGNSNGPFSPDRLDRGSAFYLVNSYIYLVNCIVDYNETDLGARATIYNDGGHLQIGSTTIENNVGYGVKIQSGDVTITNSEFVTNTFSAVGTSTDISSIADCLFIGNGTTALGGGAIENFGDLTVSKCVFDSNTADEQGGGISSSGSVVAINCLFANNSGGEGGAVWNNGGELYLTNCTFTGNSATHGGAIAEYSALTVSDNTILWGNTAFIGTLEEQQFYPNLDFPGEWSFDSCIVEGWSGQWGGEGNSGDDPMFAEGASIPMRGSPAIDTGNNDLVPDDVEDDIAGNPRFVDVPDEGEEGPPAPVDIGAYEFQIPACEGNANGDGTVDPLDAGYVLARFGCSVGTGDSDCDAADQNFDGVVDPLDVGYVLARFGECP